MNLLKKANDNFSLTPEQRETVIQNVTEAYEGVMEALGIEWKSDTHTQNTPSRIAKSLVNDLLSGCYSTSPVITSFENTEKYDGIILQNNIEVNSICCHHFLPFLGKASVGYIAGKDGKVIGLSKINRIVDFYSRRPNIQESLTKQILEHMNKVCEGNLGVAVYLECSHTCCSLRGIKHDSVMKTMLMTGYFLENKDGCKSEFLEMIRR